MYFPAGDYIALHFQNVPLTRNNHFEIIDIKGVAVQGGLLIIEQGQELIKLDRLNSGLYNILIFDNGNLLESLRFIKE